MASAISVLDLHEKLRADPFARVLDVRTPGEFSTVHLPTAFCRPLGSVEPEKLAEEFRRAPGPVYVVCKSGMRAERCVDALTKAGFADAVLVEGGTMAWIAAGYPVVRSGGGVISLERQVRIATGSLVVLGCVLGYGVHPGFYSVAGVIGAGLVFAGLTDSCALGMLLAKMPWNSKI